MMRRFNLLLFVLLIGIGQAPLRADDMQTNLGHIGLDPERSGTSDLLQIEYVAPGGPAAMAGIRKGDWLMSIDGVSARGISRVKARDLVEGPIGSVVKLLIRRDGSTDTEVSIVRRSLLDAYMPAAIAGDARAQYSMGRFYGFGPSGARDLVKAANLFLKSADQGYAYAEAQLGYAYEWGRGVPMDQEKASKWLLKAAKQGVAFAEKELAGCYYYGNGVEKSDREAFDWYYSAAAQDDPEAQFYLAQYYETGRGIARDNHTAFNWFYRSAENGNANAATSLAYMYEYGIGVPADPAAGAVWNLRAARQGIAYSEREIAVDYFYGTGIGQSDRDAFAWFYSASSQGDAEAEQYLAKLYRTGRGVRPDDRAAFNWYYQSARAGDAYGQWGLGYMYAMGLGVGKNEREAIKWLEKAEIGLPNEPDLKKSIASASIRAFWEDPDASSLDLSVITQAYHRPIAITFAILFASYVAGGCALLYFGLKAPVGPPRLRTAVGWLLFFVESEALALYAILLFEKSLTADTLLFALVIITYVPVLISSGGRNRTRIWKSSPVRNRTLLLYGAGGWIASCGIFCLYAGVYHRVAHVPLPAQPTYGIISQVKHQSAWFAYTCVAFFGPITEELIFRSYIFDALCSRYSGKAAVIISAFAFSLMHFQCLYFVPLFAFGLVQGWLRLKSGSVRLPMIVHIVNNGLSLAFGVR